MKNTSEAWLPVPGYQGKYLISDQGNIRKVSLNTTEKPIQIRIDRAGYLTVRLCQGSKIKTLFIHRLVAAAFVPNLYGKQFVNHKNGNKVDCCAVNLEWTTHAENIQHAYDSGLLSKRTQRKTVIDLCTGQRFYSAREAATFYGIPYPTFKNYLNGRRPNPTCLQYAKREAA
ncbi:MAG TPA: NUMOD4 domain-containing protein [Flavisolibacter sp.]|jgi:hypothetical protein|nr:NUMOD4 domain-containing protein [Flavisolibacter sp.]